MDYVQNCILGKATGSDFDRYVNGWLISDSKVRLSEYLGFTEDEWKSIINAEAGEVREKVICDIINSRRSAIDNIVNTYTEPAF